MNTALVGRLIQLRYRLLWAKTRSRNGRIALFLTGYLLLILLIVLLGTGGIGAAIVAVRAGKAELVAQALLGGLFVQAIIATNIMGFGMSAVFSDTELRRYPLSALDRRVTRHLSSLLDPFWFLVLALGLGLAVGLYAMGAGNLALGFVAVLLLFAANYLMARILAVWVDRLMATKGGAAVLLIPILLLSIAPGALAPVFRNNPGLVPAILAWLRFTPPFGAAAAMTHADFAGLRGLGLVLVWIAGLAALLVRMEQRPRQRHAAQSSKIVWEGPFDRIGAWFGPALGPLVAHWLCFFCRNQKTRTISLMSLPLLGFLTYQTGAQMSRHGRPEGFFIAGIGTFPAIAFMGISRMAVNPFGYTGGAFRRYFLLPLNPADILRSASYAALVVGGAMLPVAALAWIALSPLRADPRLLIMLLSSGIGGMFLIHGLGLWVMLYNPRKANYNSALGNDLSLGGNILLIGSIVCSMLLPRVVNFFYPAVFSPANWWMLLSVPALGFLFYRTSLNAAGPVFTARREKLLAVVEGKD